MNQIRNQSFRVAIYLRLSKEDGDFSFSKDGKSESDSIHNQRELLLEFIKKQPEMELAGEYKDDGFTGTNFERPEFKRMIEDCQKGIINCVLVKDLSRLGRDYIECGRYIEKIFPQMGVRFISLNDSVDTMAVNSADNIVIPFKNLINDSYSRDISIKVRSNLAVKRRQGECVANFAVYGYKKDPSDKNHLIIDEYAADIVRDIFKWKVEGFSPKHIAEKLNELEILSPLEYKKANGSRYQTKFKTHAKAVWSDMAVRRILKNEIYTGTLVQGKRTTPNYKIKKEIYKAEDEWIKVSDRHEAIINRPQFDLVQLLLGEDTRASTHKMAVHPYCGRIFCGECGAPAVRKSVSTAGKKYVYYVCGANKANKEVCGNHSIREKQLNEAVLTTIQRQIEVILDMDRAMQKIEALSWERSELHKIETNIEIQNEIVKRNNDLKLGMYEDLQKGLLTKEEFFVLKEELASRIDSAKRAIEELTRERSSIQHGLSQPQGWLSQFKKFKNITEISRLVVVNLIERINIYEGAEIEVIFQQRDQFSAILDFLKEQKTAVKRKICDSRQEVI